MRQTRIALGGALGLFIRNLLAKFGASVADLRQCTVSYAATASHARWFIEILESRRMLDGLPSWVAPGSVATWNASTNTLNVTGPTTIIADPAGPGAPACPTSIAGLPTIVADGSAAQIKVNYDADIAGAQGTSASSISLIHIAGLSLTEGAKMEIESAGGDRTDADHYCLVIGASGLTTPPVFNLDQNGIPDSQDNFTPITSTLDLADNDLLILCAQQAGASAQTLADGKVEGNIQADLQNAFDGGAWDQPGLTTSVAPIASQGCALGYATSDELACTSFDGVTFGSGAIMVKYTLIGDTQLSGTVSGSDDNAVLNNYDTPGDWNHANFFYTGSYSPNGTFLDGTVDYSDFYGVWGSYDVPGVTATSALARGLTITTDPVNPQSTLDIAWDTPAEGGNFSYDVFGSPDGVNFNQINTAAISGNFFAANTIDGQTALTPGTKYWFYVTVHGSGINSATRSMVTSIATPTATVNSGGTQITLTSQSAAAFVSFPNPVNYTWTALTIPTGAASPTFTENADGTAMTTTASVHAIGNYIFQVSVTDSAGTVLSTAEVPVTVAPVRTTLTVFPSTVTLGAGQGQQFTVSATDQFDNRTDASGATWSLGDLGNPGSGDQGTIGSTGYYTAPSDTFIVTASLAGQIGYASISAAPVITQQATYTQPSPTTVQLAMSAASDDDLEYSWQATSLPPGVSAPTGDTTGETATLELAGAGAYTFEGTATDPGTGLLINSTVSVQVAQRPSAVSMSPKSATPDSVPPADLAATERQGYGATKFTATALDQFGNAMSEQPDFSWTSGDASIGWVDSSGLFYTTGWNVGLTDVTATADGISASAPVYVAADWGSYVGIYSMVDPTLPGSDPLPSGTAITNQNPLFSISTPSGGAVINSGWDGGPGWTFEPPSGSDSMQVDIKFSQPVDGVNLSIGSAATTLGYWTDGVYQGMLRSYSFIGGYDDVTEIDLTETNINKATGVALMGDFGFAPQGVDLAAFRAGNNFGKLVPRSVQTGGEPNQYVIPVNDGHYENLPGGLPDDSDTTAPIDDGKMEVSDHGTPIDPDFGEVTLFEGASTSPEATVTLASSDPSALRFFDDQGQQVQTFSSPEDPPTWPLGYLGEGGPVDLWFEGLKADPNVTLTLTLTEPSG
jgi:hypothetical protein